MAVTAIEATIEKGQLRLPENVRLPERAKVYLVITEEETEGVELPPLPPVVHIRSPRFANPQDAAHFQKFIVTEE
jgi:hypothetical protein